MARAASSAGYLERLIAGAEGRSAVRAPYRRAWGPSAVPMLERPGASTPEPSRRSSEQRDRPGHEPVPATPSPVRPGPPPVERPPGPRAAAEPPTAPPPASAGTPQAAAEPPSPRTEADRSLPVTVPHPRTVERAVRRSKPARRPVPQPPSLATGRAASTVPTAPPAPPPRRTSTSASTPRHERPRDPVRDAIPAAATRVLAPTRRPPIARREPQSQARPLVQIGTVDVHVAAPPAPPVPPPPVPAATIPSGPLSRPAPVFGLAQG